MSTREGSALGTAAPSPPELEAFLAAVGATGVGDRSLHAYRQGVERFLEYLAPRSLADATESDSRKFIAYLCELGVTPASLDAYRRILSAFFEKRALRAQGSSSRTVDAEASASQEEAAEWSAEEPPDTMKHAPGGSAPGWGFDAPVPSLDAPQFADFEP